MIVLFYVDDVLVLYHKNHEEQGKQVIAGLKQAYEFKDQGDIEHYLGIRVIRDRKNRKIYLSHDAYIEKIAKRFNLTEDACPSMPLPQVELRKYQGQATKAEVKEYQEKVGSLLYAAITIRLDVAFASSQLSYFLTNPSPVHRVAVNHAIRYLYSIRFLGIAYSGFNEG